MKQTLIIVFLLFTLGAANAEVANVPTPLMSEIALVLNAAKLAVCEMGSSLPDYTCEIIGWRWLDDGNALEIFHQYSMTKNSLLPRDIQGYNQPRSTMFYKVTTDAGYQWIYKDASWRYLNTSGQLPIVPTGKN